jgi:hypothetical protein
MSAIEAYREGQQELALEYRHKARRIVADACRPAAAT